MHFAWTTCIVFVSTKCCLKGWDGSPAKAANMKGKKWPEKAPWSPFWVRIGLIVYYQCKFWSCIHIWQKPRRTGWIESYVFNEIGSRSDPLKIVGKDAPGSLSQIYQNSWSWLRLQLYGLCLWQYDDDNDDDDNDCVDDNDDDDDWDSLLIVRAGVAGFVGSVGTVSHATISLSFNNI